MASWNRYPPRPRVTAYRSGALLVVLLAWALLLFRLNQVPPGFQHDQTFFSADALAIGPGNYPVYFPENFGRDPLGIYAAALMLRLTGGPTVWAVRLATVFAGVIGLALTLSLARRYLSPAAALLAGALMAGSYWFLFAARLGLEPALLIPLATAAIYFLHRGLSRRRWRDFVVAGLAGGVAIYSYLASRMLYLLVALLLAYELVSWLVPRLSRRSAPPTCWRHTAIPGLLVTLALMILVGGPFLLYLQSRPAVADQRLGELAGPITAALQGDLMPLALNVSDTMLALVWRGSGAIPYHYNPPYRPVLQPLLAVFFVLGLGWTLWRWRQRTEFLLLAALFVALLPSFITSADAITMRGVIALPLIFIITARGLEQAAAFVARLARGGPQAPGRRFLPALAALLALLLVGWHVVESSYAYHVTWAEAAPTQLIYNADLRAAAAYLDAHPTDEPVFIASDQLLDLDRRTYQIYAPRQPDVSWFPAEGSLPLPASGTALYFLPAAATPGGPAASLLAPARRDGFTLPNLVGQATASQGFRIEAQDLERVLAAADVEAVPGDLVYGDALRLNAAGVWAHDGRTDLVTRWTVLGPWPHPTPPGLPPQPIKLSAAVVEQAGYKWVQVDEPAGMPFTFWQPGQVYVEVTPLALPGDLPPGAYPVHLALYDDVGGTVAVRDGQAQLATPPAVAMVEAGPAIALGPVPEPPYPVEQPSEAAPLRVLGKWEPVAQLIAGVPQDVHLSWQAAESIPTGDLRFRWRAITPDGSEAFVQESGPLTSLPATWPAGQVYRLTHRLAPPAALPSSGHVQLEVCALAATAPIGCAAVGQTELVDQPPLLALPAPPAYPVDAAWDGVLRLAGYDLADEGGAIGLTLTWQVLQAPEMALKRFVHARDGSGQIIVQADATPANGAIPMPAWRPGEFVVDQVRLEAADRAALQSLCLGLYDPGTGARLPVQLPDGQAPADRQLCITLP